jgi:polyisoprenoid-binding protein YceI
MPYARVLIIVTVVSGFAWSAPAPFAQTAPKPAAPAPVPPAGPSKLDVGSGSRALYRVREQLVGINFPSDAIGETTSLTGTLVFRADGTIDSAQSKLTVDLRTLTSDQELRDRFIQTRVLETEKFPTAEFVPRQAKGMPYPFPVAPGSQAGFELIGDMTLHGVTREVTWTVVSTFNDKGVVAGLATTRFPFSTFGLTKPSIARLMSVDDTIQLEIQFRTMRTGL